MDVLAVHDPAYFCRQTFALFNALVGCEAHQCPVPGQFRCTPCMGMAWEGTTICPEKRFELSATLAEIDWCSDLKLPTQSWPSCQAVPLNLCPATT